jgi:hypothetical protein
MKTGGRGRSREERITCTRRWEGEGGGMRGEYKGVGHHMRRHVGVHEPVAVVVLSRSRRTLKSVNERDQRLRRGRGWCCGCRRSVQSTLS